MKSWVEKLKSYLNIDINVRQEFQEMIVQLISEAMDNNQNNLVIPLDYIEIDHSLTMAIHRQGFEILHNVNMGCYIIKIK